MASTRLSSARLPTVSWIFAIRAFLSSALARIALSTGGQSFSCSGVSCNAAFTRSILISVRLLRSAAFNRSGDAGEDVCELCALAIEDAERRRSAVVPATTIFNMLWTAPPPARECHRCGRCLGLPRFGRATLCKRFLTIVLMSGKSVLQLHGVDGAARRLSVVSSASPGSCVFPEVAAMPGSHRGLRLDLHHWPPALRTWLQRGVHHPLRKPTSSDRITIWPMPRQFSKRSPEPVCGSVPTNAASSKAG